MSQDLAQDSNSQPRKLSILLGIGIFFVPLIFSWFTLRKGYSSLVRGLSFGWLVLTLILFATAPKNAASSDSQTTAITQPEQSSEAAQIEYTKVTATELFDAYNANEMAADQRFKEKNLEVTGIVEGISSDFSDSAQVQLKTGQMFMSVMASGDKDFDQQAATLSKGQQIKLRCLGGGEIVGSPSLRKCQII